MRRLILAAALLPLTAPAAAQDVEADLDSMAHAMGDPARQEALAQALATMAEVVLDLPLAPIMGPLAEAAGEDPRAIDPDTTLRNMAPGASDVPRQIERQLPRAMGAMAGMSGALAAMLPQLRDAMARMRDALPSADLAELP